MKVHWYKKLLAIVVLYGAGFSLGGQKLGTTQGQFLKIGPGSHASGLSGAAVSILDDASALYWNPGIIAMFRSPQSYATHTDWFMDVSLEWAGLVIPLHTGTIGIQSGALLTGYLEETDEFHPYGTGRFFNSSGLYLGLTYANKVSDRLGYGITAKGVQETLADVKFYGFAIDIGTIYNVGYRDIRIGVVLSNLGPDFFSPVGYERFSMPIIYRMGVSGILTGSLYGVFQLEKPSDAPETGKIGLEFRPSRLLNIYAGYDLNPQTNGTSFPPPGASAGLTLKFSRYKFEYSISGYGYLPPVNRWSFGLRL